MVLVVALTTIRVVAFADTLEDAKEWADVKDICTINIDTSAMLNAFTTPELLVLYNRYAKEPVSFFASKKEAITKTWLVVSKLKPKRV